MSQGITWVTSPVEAHYTWVLHASAQGAIVAVAEAGAVATYVMLDGEHRDKVCGVINAMTGSHLPLSRDECEA